MSTENEKDTRAAYAVLAAAGLALAGLVWRSYHNDAPRIESYAAPAAPAAAPAAGVAGALQVETLEALNAAAEGHLASRRYGEAIRVYRRMLELEPKNASILNELGLALHYDGKSDEAVETLRKATALDPKLQRAWLSQGFVLKSTGQDAKARVALEKTIALGPSTPQGVEARKMLGR
ncbi:MAG: tetratricopeptide repeat protein [Elusimicrobia bacterium]|nr:tetratricopeptide repeat protein [Elusimicrobiota bacterium]